MPEQTQLTADDVRAFKRAVGRFTYHNDYQDFRNATGVDHRHAEREWFALQELQRGLAGISVEVLCKCVSIGQGDRQEAKT